MNMRGVVIVREDRHAGAEYAKKCGHGFENNLTLGFLGIAWPVIAALFCTGSKAMSMQSGNSINAHVARETSAVPRRQNPQSTTQTPQSSLNCPTVCARFAA